ncbi:MAG: hypothetical protein HY563_01810, partial [Ignavibacteriales bacterium]|nr:hypothetical protein [Ignavibacteriales bacterium]
MNARLFRFSQRLFVSFAFVAAVASAQTPFSQDSAYAYLRVIAGDIGPRPMGSPAERAAMEFAVSKFREFGLDEAFIMPIREAVSTAIQSGVNTKSGVAV